MFIQFFIFIFPFLKTFFIFLSFIEQSFLFLKEKIDHYFDDNFEFEDEEFELNKQIIFILLVLEFFWIIMS
jgi:uncharacterized membrane protein SpoIIM required for sporulation